MCDPEADPGDLAAATPSPPAARKETTEVKGGVIRGGIVGSPCRSRDLSDAEEVPSHRRWAAVFEDSTSAGRLQRVGSIHLHLASRWVTVRDEDNDILAGRFLQDGEDPKVGDGMDIDGFLLIVGDLREEVPIHRDIAKVCVDLTTDPPCFGGRFWVIADRDEVDDEAEVHVAEASQTVEASGSRQDGVSSHVEEEHSEASAPSSPCTPSPSMEELQECKTRRDPVLARKKMELPARKPWIGPIPKVVRNPISLSDFITPNCWIKGPKHEHHARRVHQRSVTTLIPGFQRNSRPTGAESVQDFRANFLNVLKDNGPEVALVSRKSQMHIAGYMAQDLSVSVLQADLDSVSLGYLAQDAPDQGVSCVLTTSSGIAEELSHARCFQPPRTRVRSSKPGFPPLGSGRATRIPSPVAPAGSVMAGRGSKPPPLQRHSGQQTGQGNPPVAKPSPTVAAQPGKAQRRFRLSKERPMFLRTMGACPVVQQCRRGSRPTRTNSTVDGATMVSAAMVRGTIEGVPLLEVVEDRPGKTMGMQAMVSMLLRGSSFRDLRDLRIRREEVLGKIGLAEAVVGSLDHPWLLPSSLLTLFLPWGP
ncbi:hypothetical protein ZWY2020_059360 [Hordeum vulgare]|nr:hypothetical protein ZWY2020_059360 [Hordeum vulgare]